MVSAALAGPRQHSVQSSASFLRTVACGQLVPEGPMALWAVQALNSKVEDRPVEHASLGSRVGHESRYEHRTKLM